MKKCYIIGNWKSNKTNLEANAWLEQVKSTMEQVTSDKEIIVCPSFTQLPTMGWYVGQYNVPLSLGSQDISPFDHGAYTGEVYGEQIKEWASYAIIGHSERRTHFGETHELLEKKVAIAQKSGITPIFCVQDETTPIPQGVTIVAYEPPTAIGSGKPDTPENANEVATKIKERSRDCAVLYGGSVTPDNVNSFTGQPQIDGVLVGGASLDAQTFLSLIQHA